MIPIILVAQAKSSRSFLDDFIKANGFNRDLVFEISPLKKEIVLSQIKEVLKFMLLSSDQSRLFIFHNFDTAAAEVQNSLLKSLEDFSVKNQFILVVENEYAVFPTLRSRSKIIRLTKTKLDIRDQENLALFLERIETSADFAFLSQNTVKALDREQVLDKIEQMLLIYKKKLADDSKSVKVIKKILNLKSLILTNNLNPQFTYDNLLIFISKAFRMKT